MVDKELQLKLLQQSLEEKWFRESKANVNSDCPFCVYYKNRCCNCTVPISICDDKDGSSFIERMYRKYSLNRYYSIKISDLTVEELADIQGLFKAEIDKLDEVTEW